MVLRRLLSSLTGTDVPEPVHRTLEETRQALATSFERNPDELFAYPPVEFVLHLKDHPAYSEANVDLLIAMAAVDPDKAPHASVTGTCAPGTPQRHLDHLRHGAPCQGEDVANAPVNRRLRSFAAR